jgi:DNA replication and repair protein RecF
VRHDQTEDGDTIQPTIADPPVLIQARISMLVRSLELEEFRCFRHLHLVLPDRGLRLVGANGSGKTSLIEALYMLATTKSFRASLERHLVHLSSGSELGIPPYARLAAELFTETERSTLEIVLMVDPASGTVRKLYRRDGRSLRAVEFVGTLRVVLFSPEDLELVTGSPQQRRRYLDTILSTIDRAYLRALARYTRILEHRNSLLKSLAERDQRAADEQLAYWDEQLVTYGAYLLVARLRFLAEWGPRLRDHFQALDTQAQVLTTAYLPSIDLPKSLLSELAAREVADAQLIVGARYRETLERLRPDELRRGSTLVGPHRDDVEFLLGEEPLTAFGSRGVQRLAVLAAKLAEIAVIHRVTDDWPVLLLDDALSELDQQHRAHLLATLSALPAQLILTATDSDVLETPVLSSLPLFRLKDGRLELG